MLCPLTGKLCCTDCAWYLKDGCAITVIARTSCIKTLTQTPSS